MNFFSSFLWIVLVFVGAYINSTAAALRSDAVFAAVKELLLERPSEAKAINANYLFKVTQNGKVAKQWTLDFENLKVYDSNNVSTKIDVTMTLSDQNMVAIVKGELDPTWAYFSGKLKIVGDVFVAKRLIPFLKLVKDKI